MRPLPRGPFDAYVQRQPPGHTSGRFGMGVGAVFALSRLSPAGGSDFVLPAAGPQTDLRLADELLTLIAARGLECVALSQVAERLAGGGAPFVAFTVDAPNAADASALSSLFARHEVPLSLMLDMRERPAWPRTLEAVLATVPGLVCDMAGQPAEVPLRSHAERLTAAHRLTAALATLPPVERDAAASAFADAHGVSLQALAPVAAGNIAHLAHHAGVSLGVDGAAALDDGLPYDVASEALSVIRAGVENAGVVPAAIALAGGDAAAHHRNAAIAISVGFSLGVTGIEGALWPEHARAPLLLPRIVLGDDPASLSRVLMLAGGAMGDAPGLRRLG